MPIKNAPDVSKMDLDAVKQSLCEAVLERLQVVQARDKQGKPTDSYYFAVPKPIGERGADFEALGVAGKVNIAWFQLQDATAAQAATAERIKATVANGAAKLSREEREALAKQLLAE